LAHDSIDNGRRHILDISLVENTPLEQSALWTCTPPRRGGGRRASRRTEGKAGTAGTGATTEAVAAVVLEPSAPWKPVRDHQAIAKVPWEFTKGTENPNAVRQ
jgi:hypothetical protein